MQRTLLCMVAMSSYTNAEECVLLFLAVTASWAGVPATDTAALTAAAVAASQGQFDLAALIRRRSDLASANPDWVGPSCTTSTYDLNRAMD